MVYTLNILDLGHSMILKSAIIAFDHATMIIKVSLMKECHIEAQAKIAGVSDYNRVETFEISKLKSNIGSV